MTEPLDKHVLALADFMVNTARSSDAPGYWIHSTPEVLCPDGSAWRVTIMAYAERHPPVVSPECAKES